ncbi:hypothetical protein LTR37_000159 [Vermiconidia calcicola]|uniref:Uncharacterized protein n=1 Tax=Vermiconidia calcicola TaxID=1690605 RepID=A0ACC3NZP1_9PEZI|nr:hypothetical protein LTR37_000159 [Vermiconidia calcicola]
MDLDEIRRKRIKLFSAPDPTSDGVLAALSSMPPSSLMDDERYARELQAEIENEERPKRSTLKGVPATTSNVVIPNITYNQQYAQHLQAGTENEDQPNSSNPASYFDMDPLSISEDETYARELQGELPREKGFARMLTDENDRPPTITSPRIMDAAEGISKSGRGRLQDSVMDDSNDAKHVRQFTSCITTVDCARCHNPQTLSKEGLADMFNAFIASEAKSISFFHICNNCRGKTCFGCRMSWTTAVAYGNVALNNKHYMWHCDQGRLALIWFLLCGYDSQVKNNNLHSTMNTCSTTSIWTEGSGVGYSGLIKGNGVGFGYGKDSNEFDRSFLSEEEDEYNVGGIGRAGFRLGRRGPKKVFIDSDDVLTAETMTALSATLPDRNGFVPTNFDNNPPVILASMLLRSSILDKAAELLRNDSLEDARRRFSVYDSLLKLVRCLAQGGEVTAATLHDQRAINKVGHNLLDVSYGLPTRVRDEATDHAPPLSSCMANLASQSKMMLKSARAKPAEFETEEGQQMLLLCTNIVDVTQVLQMDAEKGKMAAGKTRMAQPDKNAWQKDLLVVDVSDKDILKHHYFAKQAGEIASPPTGRMRQIINHIASLKTSLPPGIFVRHGDGRLDVMKIIIVGPKGTPYENGLFEFHLLCPIEYPNKPPMMQFMTTGGGAHGFNPNLYNNGKVCLSLLGTWNDGRPWTPGESTLLQLFVSIQSMIFCEEPICNEPGDEEMGGTVESRNYNRYQHPMVVKYAMLEWLNGKQSLTPRPESRSKGRRLGDWLDTAPKKEREDDKEGIWAAVVKNHFEANQDEIVECVVNWIIDRQEHEVRKKQYHGTGSLGRTLGQDDGAANTASSTFEISGLEKHQDLPSRLEAALLQFPAVAVGQSYLEDSDVDSE